MSNKRSKHRSSIKSTNLTPQVQNTQVRRDGWSNLLTNLGSQNSRINTTQYAFAPRLQKQTLTNIYTTDCIARQVVNMIVDDAMRGFINAEEELLDELKRLKFKQKITDAATWARLYGGSALVAFADDGQDMEMPLNLEQLHKVVSVQVYDRYQISSLPTDLNTDFHSEHYGQPEVFSIILPSGTSFRVHRSRMHMFAGERVPEEQYIANGRWDDSIIQSLYEPLRNYGQSMNALAEITQDAIQTTISINGLTDILAFDGEQKIIERLHIMDMSRSVSNTVLLDAEHETYTKHASNVAGLSDIVQKIQEQIAAGARRSLTRLFGMTSKGLGNSGNEDSDNDNNTTEAYRSDEIEPCIDWMIDILEAQTMWIDKPKSFDWSFSPLKVSNEHELAKNRLLAAQTDQIYMDRGISTELLFSKRYAGGGGFQTDIFISDKELAEAESENEMIDVSEQNMQIKVAEVKERLAIESKAKMNKDSLDEKTRIKEDLEIQIFQQMAKTFKDISNGQ